MLPFQDTYMPCNVYGVSLEVTLQILFFFKEMFLIESFLFKNTSFPLSEILLYFLSFFHLASMEGLC